MQSNPHLVPQPPKRQRIQARSLSAYLRSGIQACKQHPANHPFFSYLALRQAFGQTDVRASARASIHPCIKALSSIHHTTPTDNLQTRMYSRAASYATTHSSRQPDNRTIPFFSFIYNQPACHLAIQGSNHPFTQTSM